MIVQHACVIVLSCGMEYGRKLWHTNTYTKYLKLRLPLFCFMLSAVHTDNMRAGGMSYVQKRPGGKSVGGIVRREKMTRAEYVHVKCPTPKYSCHLLLVRIWVTEQFLNSFHLSPIQPSLN